MTLIAQSQTDHAIDSAPERASHQKTVLMCPPDYFTVSYRINPWMFPDQATDQRLAARQWQRLYDTYRELGYVVELIKPEPGLPDMVYAANGGFVLDGQAYEARFRHPERQPEGPKYLEYLEQLGYQPRPARTLNEGEGDFLLVGDTIVAAHGFRSAPDSHSELATIFGREVLSLKLVDPRFYHLDTAFAVLDDDTVAFYPEAFDEDSRDAVMSKFPEVIVASEADAVVLGLNLFSDGRRVVMAEQAVGLQEQLQHRGFETYGVNLSELLRGGGGVKCCTLELRK